MAPRLAVRSATLCVAILGAWLAAGGSAEAARRQVAVVALSPDAEAEAYANLIGTTLVHHDTLAPLEQGAMIGALVGPLLDESGDRLAAAKAALGHAEGALGSFVFPMAISTAQGGHEALHAVVPTTESIGLYADLALTLAKAKLGENKQAEAARFFGLVHLLSPGRRLDPALHLPEVVAAFQAAQPVYTRVGTLALKGSGRVWIDGKDLGAVQQPVALTEGLHVVWLEGFERKTVGRQVWVEAGRESVVDLGEAPAPLPLRVQRARLLLHDAVDRDARGAAMRRLAELLGVHDAVLITMPNGKLIVQTWHDREEGELRAGFSAYRLAAGEAPIALLKPLAPPVPLVAGPPPPPPPWYRRRGVQASIAAGAVSVIVGSVILSRALAGADVGLGRDITFQPPRMAGP